MAGIEILMAVAVFAAFAASRPVPRTAAILVAALCALALVLP
jgi:hypothetical protein